MNGRGHCHLSIKNTQYNNLNYNYRMSEGVFSINDTDWIGGFPYGSLLSEDIRHSLSKYVRHLLRIYGVSETLYTTLMCLFICDGTNEGDSKINMSKHSTPYQITTATGRNRESIRKDLKELVKSGLVESMNPKEYSMRSYPGAKYARTALYRVNPKLQLGYLPNVTNILVTHDIGVGGFTVYVDRCDKAQTYETFSNCMSVDKITL